MANQIPIKAITTSGNVTGLSEFQPTDTIAIADGGTGASTASLALTNLGVGTTSSPTFNNLVINGDLTVSGTTTTINTSNLQVEDPLIKLGRLNTADISDIGWYGTFSLDGGTTQKYAGIFRDSSDNKFKVFTDTTEEPTTTVNLANVSLNVGTIVANIEGNVTGQISDLSNHTTTDLAEGTNLYYTDARVRLNSLDSMTPPTADLSAGNFKITNLSAPLTNLDASNKLYVDTQSISSATVMSIVFG